MAAKANSQTCMIALWTCWRFTRLLHRRDSKHHFQSRIFKPSSQHEATLVKFRLFGQAQDLAMDPSSCLELAQRYCCCWYFWYCICAGGSCCCCCCIRCCAASCCVTACCVTACCVTACCVTACCVTPACCG